VQIAVDHKQKGDLSGDVTATTGLRSWQTTVPNETEPNKPEREHKRIPLKMDKKSSFQNTLTLSKVQK
jgi:hypothetical protein